MPNQNLPPLDFGYVVEGVIEQDPVTGQHTIRTVDQQGKPINFDVNAALGRYVGQEVRFILTSFETINRLEEMAKQGELGEVIDPSPKRSD